MRIPKFGLPNLEISKVYNIVISALALMATLTLALLIRTLISFISSLVFVVISLMDFSIYYVLLLLVYFYRIFNTKSFILTLKNKI
ncbi:hypothetical protein BA173_03445 [Rickettsia sp. MEAM1 (Bemisia tabaci)]|nr:hypothetical protein BA173_03445 [Rickettsia sp. MEAM1 (Bemisia tabaci)]ODA37619.1 hypothetical protein A8V34_05005 [Rickettsia sp. wq]ODA37905.1 hypothetical protein A8V33_05495 [Rickettsia sp. wb]